jgi:chemotaxis protein histidine kinase CheA
MTISNTLVVTRTNTNGVAHTFSFAAPFYDPDDLIVSLVTIADGTIALQTRDTHYTVSDTGSEDESGGTITFIDGLLAPTAPANGKTVVILRKPDLVQDFNPSTEPKYPVDAGESALDRIYQLLQFVEWRSGRAIRLNDAYADATLTLPTVTERAGKALEFDDDGNVTVGDTAADLLEDNEASQAAAEAAATAAAASASAAANSAANAANSAANAASSASAASTSASAAATAETNAETAETNAETAQAAAEAAKAAAETAETNAETAQAAAASSASSASTSASNAATSASTASTQASNAATSASNASTSASNAATSATNASNSAAAAATAETNAETAETNAEAAQAAAEAAQAAAEVARDAAIAASENPALTFVFDSSTADADPGNGEFRFNNGTLASVTTVYIDNQDRDANTITGWLDSFDDNTSDNKGILLFKGIETPNAFLIGTVGGTVVNGTGYRKVSVTVLASGGTFTAGEAFSVLFAPAGDAGSGLEEIVDDTSPQLGGDLDLNGFVIEGLEIGADVQAWSAVLDATTASFLTAHATKLGHITVTQAVDLDAIETRVNGLDAAVVLRGTWDASSGSFPGGGTAQAGDSYIVSVGGTVDSVVFVANDRIIAITDNASTTTFAANWFKADYTDAVLSVDGSTGAVSLSGTYAAIGRQVISGGGLTGGGTLAADRTLAVGAGTGITVNADDVAVDKASDANVRAAASNKVITTDLVESASAGVALTDAATVAVDWDTAINFTLTVTANRAIGNPTNGQPGTWRTILVQGNDTTDRTITFGNQYLGEVPTITDCDSGRWYLLMIFCVSSTHFVVSSKKANGT